MNRIEDHIDAINNKVNQIELQINSHLIPTQGVFFDGQIFDAYELASRIMRSAKKSLVLIDNYIDESTLLHLAKKEKQVHVLLLTPKIDSQLALDVKKANAQYGGFSAKHFSVSHDRFIIVDETDVYLFGASLKDLGKKHVVSPVEPWFGIVNMDARSVQEFLKQVDRLK